MRYHGNYCGPWWSDGVEQHSVATGQPGIDEFDESCRRHDRAYALGANLDGADDKFIEENWNQSIKRSVAALAVSTNRVSRAIDKYYPDIFTDKMNASKRLRGAATPKTNAKSATTLRSASAQQNRAQQTLGRGLSMSRPTAPVAVGTSIRASNPVVKRTTEGARIQGSDFLATVEGQGVATFGLGKSALLSPAYFSSAILGNLARSFEKYRFRYLRVHYVPKVSTTTTGQIILCSQRSVSEPGLQPESGTFLPRAMSQGNACFSPLWVPAHIDIDCNMDWKLVDPSTTTDPDDCIHEELQAHVQVGSTAQVGYLIAEYDIEFKEPIYQPHSTRIPIYTGPGLRATLVDGLAVNAANDDWSLNEFGGTTNLTSMPNGTIFRAVFDIQGSTAPVGAAFATMLATGIKWATTTTTSTTSTTAVPLIGGATLYMVVVGSSLEIYNSIESAVAGVGSGQLFYRLATTATGTYNFDVALIRLGPTELSNVQ